MIVANTITRPVTAVRVTLPGQFGLWPAEVVDAAWAAAMTARATARFPKS